jgi:uncharacterized protein (DUF1684 family)
MQRDVASGPNQTETRSGSRPCWPAVFFQGLPSAVLLGILAAAGSVPARGDDRYEQEIASWRRQRELGLKADDGWLTVIGLFWLQSGESRLGSDPSSDIMLPAHAPGWVGTLTLRDGRVRFQAAPGVAVARNGQPFPSGEIHSDADEHPDTLAVGDIKMILLRRGARLALRLKDNRSSLRARFAGLRWYPVRQDWRIPARFVAYPTPKKLVMDTIVGEPEIEESPGYVTFEREGKVYSLQAVRQRSGALWFVFRDGTSGRTTHGGARQLSADPPRDDLVILDFNQAVNLPCAYIPYSTCPLAPPQNRLSLAIEAGELKYESP